MKQLLLTSLLTALSVAVSIKLSDEGYVGCKNIQSIPVPTGGAITLQRCFGQLSVKIETIDLSRVQ